MRVMRCLLPLLPVIFLIACSHQPPVDQMSSCSTDVYLAKYHCSFSEVKKAAESGDSDAAYALGYMYYYGIDTPRDLDSAKVWIGRAALQGQSLAKQAQVVIGVAKPPVISTAPSVLQKQSVMRHGQRESGYTLQLMGTRQLSEVQAFIRVHHLEQQATYYEASYHHAKWYMLIYGDYPTWHDAHVAANDLSSKIPGLKPWVKPNREVKAEVSLHRVL